MPKLHKNIEQLIAYIFNQPDNFSDIEHIMLATGWSKSKAYGIVRMVAKAHPDFKRVNGGIRYDPPKETDN